MILKKKKNSETFCLRNYSLVGLVGVGKTTIAYSIAESLGKIEEFRLEAWGQ